MMKRQSSNLLRSSNKLNFMKIHAMRASRKIRWAFKEKGHNTFNCRRKGEILQTDHKIERCFFLSIKIL